MASKKREKNKLIILLKDLETKELKRLETYINCSLFNKNKRAIHLFELLVKQHPHFETLDKAALFTQIFPQKTDYNDSLLRMLFGFLTNLVKKFLAFTQYEQQTNYQKICLLGALADRQFPNNVFEKEFHTISRAQKKQVSNIEFLHHQFQMAELAYHYSNVTAQRSTQNNTLQSVIYHIDAYYLAVKLRYAWIALNRQNIVNVDYEMGLFFEEMLQLLPNNAANFPPLITLYYHVISLLLELDKEEHYLVLKDDLQKQENGFSIHVINPVYTILINYCRLKAAQGKQAYTQEALTLYKIMLKQKLLEQDKYLSSHHFKNIVSIGLVVKDMDWVIHFIEQYQAKLNPIHRKTVYLYNKALCLFIQKDYQQSATYLQQLQFSTAVFVDVYHDISYRLLLIRTYYETKNWTVLLSAIEAFRMYINRNKVVPKSKAQAYGHFIKFIKQLVHLQWGKTNRLLAIKQKIIATKPIDQKGWLLEKVEELGGRGVENVA